MSGSSPRGSASYTFEASTGTFAISDDALPYKRDAPKRTHIPTACTECKRRKVRCDGKNPCGPCMSSSASSRGRRRRCCYVTPRPRVMPSKKALDDASNSLAECHRILRRLFPTQGVKDLLPLSREDLIALLREGDDGTRLPESLNPSFTNDLCSSPLRVSLKQTPRPAHSPLSSPHSQSGSVAAAKSVASLLSSDRGLTNLEQVPTPDAEWEEERRERAQEHVPAEADDVNALSFAVDRQVSYLGISSIRAALLVMLKLCPTLRQKIATEAAPSAPERLLVTVPRRGENETSNIDKGCNSGSESRSLRQPRPSLTQTQSQQQLSKTTRLTRIAWSRRGQALVDAYFQRFHMYIPMLDEPTFRAEFAGGKRTDEPWQALANMVLALGSVAAGRLDDQEVDHAVYYERAVSLLPLTALGSSHIETVQSLALIGGEYLHYINRPNMANGVLGAAVRMAGALGLHKDSLTAPPPSSISPALHAALETRRRTWWSLLCLDTWATMLTGRPSFGRYELVMSIMVPDAGLSENSHNHFGDQVADNGREEAEAEAEYEMEDQTSDAQLLRQLAESVKFAKIATKIQDAFAVSPIITTAQRQEIDSQLAAWHESQTWSALRSTSPQNASHESVSHHQGVTGEEAAPWHFAQCLMKWRYQDLRMLLHRPVLLLLANGGCNEWNECSPDDVAAVEMCLALAIATVEDIEREWEPNRISGWKAAWYLHQASMVPLLILLWNPSNVPRETVLEPCRRIMPIVLRLLETMKPWSLTADRSCALIGCVFEAATQEVTAQAPNENGTTATSFAAGDHGVISATRNNNYEQVLGDGSVNRAMNGDLARRAAVAGNPQVQQGLEFNMGLDFAFLGFEQDAVMGDEMGGAMGIDSYSMVDPFWG